jgi:hypothetical protein
MRKKITLSILIMFCLQQITVYESDCLLTNDSDDNYCSALIDAIYNRDYEKIEKAIVAGADLNFKSAYGLTPLWHAVNSENVRTVNILIKQGTATSENCGLALINAYDGFIKYGFDGMECYMMNHNNIFLPDVLPLATLERDFDYADLQKKLLFDEFAWREICGYSSDMNVFLEHSNVMFDIMICLIKAGADLNLAHTNIFPFDKSLRDNHPYNQNDDYICTILDSVLDMESMLIKRIFLAENNLESEKIVQQAGGRSKEECLGAMRNFLNLIVKIKLELQQAKS